MFLDWMFLDWIGLHRTSTSALSWYAAQLLPEIASVVLLSKIVRSSERKAFMGRAPRKNRHPPRPPCSPPAARSSPTTTLMH
eukprot:430097-Prorocentrum_lima.AAC.1